MRLVSSFSRCQIRANDNGAKQRLSLCLWEDMPRKIVVEEEVVTNDAAGEMPNGGEEKQAEAAVNGGESCGCSY